MGQVRINSVLGLKISKDEPFETISKYILRKTEKLPEEGQEVKIKKGKFIVHNVKHKRIESVKYVKK